MNDVSLPDTTRPSVSVRRALAAQRGYAGQIAKAPHPVGLVVAEAFVRGIRDLGYRSTATAIDELVDNALQAGARNILIAFGFETSEKKPTAIAIVDDGHGIVPEMLPLATVWGGTHREGDRTGFGRYGYGLPSACVSQGRRFTVYSRTTGSPFHAVSLDIDEIGQGRYVNAQGQLAPPEPIRARPPDWVAQSFAEVFHPDPPRYKTVVIIEKLDRLSRTTASGLQRFLVDHLGVTYRNFLSATRMSVQGMSVEPIDPLFLTPGYRYHDIDEDGAQALDPVEIVVPEPTTGEPLGMLRVRYALFPTTFASIDKARPARGHNANPRLAIMRDHNGIIFLRMGRQIDVVTGGLGHPFQNNDRYWKVEIDFTASLDEHFGINTSKQRIEVSDYIWDILRAHGVDTAINQLRMLNNDARYNQIRESFPVDPWEPTDGRPLLDSQRDAISSHRIDLDTMPGGPFFDTKVEDGQITLVINTAHRFFTGLYATQFEDRLIRHGLEALLLTLVEAEIASNEVYAPTSPRRDQLWSVRLDRALERLQRQFGRTR